MDDEQGHELSSDLRVAVNRLARRLRAEKADDALSDGQTAVLGLLSVHGPQTLGQLSEHEHVTPPSMNRTVGSLVDAGYVERDSDPGDGRRVIHRLTDAGTALVRETRRRRDQWLDIRLSALTAEELDALTSATAVLRRLSER